MTDSIDQVSPIIAKAHARWQRNRDVIEGADAVRARPEAYIDRLPGQTDEEYRYYVRQVPFWHGAAGHHDRMVGMVTRKPSSLTPDKGQLQPIFDTITATGQTVHDLAKDVFSETVKTNFTFLLVDHPASAQGLNAANAIAMGFRPFVAAYVAESILEATPAVVRNVRKLVRVRLKDDEDTVRELVLVDGQYQVIIHRRTGGEWLADAPVIPTMQGKPLDFIPIVMVCTEPGKFHPIKAPLDTAVLGNVDALRVAAQYTLARMWTSNPLLVAKMVDREKSPVCVTPGNVNYLDSPEGDLKFVEYNGASMEDLKQAVDDVKEDANQASLTTGEKKSVESAESHSLRKAAEDSHRASIAHAVSRGIEEALNIVARWVGVTEPVAFALSTDFDPTPLSSQDITVRQALVASGNMSKQTFFEMMQRGEVFPDSLTYDEEKARIEDDIADMPTAHAGLSTFPQEPVEGQEAEEPTDR
jgi:hypothetical protein